MFTSLESLEILTRKEYIKVITKNFNIYCSLKQDMEPLPVDYKKKIKILEEELVHKQAQIEKLEKENKVLFQLALKRSEEQVALTDKKDLPTTKSERNL